MGGYRNTAVLQAVAWVIAGLIVALNVFLVVLTVTG
jgi:Mn2+/Fe2+ NRAMP family transporter